MIQNHTRYPVITISRLDFLYLEILSSIINNTLLTYSFSGSFFLSFSGSFFLLEKNKLLKRPLEASSEKYQIMLNTITLKDNNHEFTAL